MLISTNSGLYSAVSGRARIPMAEAMRFFARVGFEAVDVNFAATIYEGAEKHEPILDGDWKQNLDEVMRAIQSGGMVISHTHLPFYNYTEDSDKRRNNDEKMRLSIEASAYIGAKYAVIHPHRDSAGCTLVAETVDLLTPFNTLAKSLGVTLCVENMFSTAPETLLSIATLLDCDVCWDVGHANIGGFDQYNAITLLADHLKVLHLHDNYGTQDDHTLPFIGNIHWDNILYALHAIGYTGTFNYEVAASKLPLEMREAHARYMLEAAKLLLHRAV